MGRVVAETEKSSDGYFARIALTIVVFPAPLGAETTMSFPLDIQDKLSHRAIGSLNPCAEIQWLDDPIDK
jgi:hypothetical protein